MTISEWPESNQRPIDFRQQWEAASITTVNRSTNSATLGQHCHTSPNQTYTARSWHAQPYIWHCNKYPTSHTARAYHLIHASTVFNASYKHVSCPQCVQHAANMTRLIRRPQRPHSTLDAIGILQSTSTIMWMVSIDRQYAWRSLMWLEKPP